MLRLNDLTSVYRYRPNSYILLYQMLHPCRLFKTKTAVQQHVINNNNNNNSFTLALRFTFYTAFELNRKEWENT